MLSNALNPNYTHLHSGINSSICTQPVRAWVNCSQFIISSYAISNSWTKNLIDLKSKEAKPELPTAEMKKKVSAATEDKEDAAKAERKKAATTTPAYAISEINDTSSTIMKGAKRAAQLAIFAGLYALHQYSKSNAYYLIGAMVATKVASNLYIYNKSQNITSLPETEK